VSKPLNSSCLRNLPTLRFSRRRMEKGIKGQCVSRRRRVRREQDFKPPAPPFYRGLLRLPLEGSGRPFSHDLDRASQWVRLAQRSGLVRVAKHSLLSRIKYEGRGRSLFFALVSSIIFSERNARKNRKRPLLYDSVATRSL
jgi:hypothetical protein